MKKLIVGLLCLAMPVMAAIYDGVREEPETITANVLAADVVATGDINMDSHSITNLSPNSILFDDGTTFGSLNVRNWNGMGLAEVTANDSVTTNMIYFAASNELSNPKFDSAADWLTNNIGWVIENGYCTFAQTIATGTLQHVSSIVSGHQYIVLGNVIGDYGFSVLLSLGGVSGSPLIAGTRFREVITAIATNGLSISVDTVDCGIWDEGEPTVSFDNIAVYDITGVPTLGSAKILGWDDYATDITAHTNLIAGLTTDRTAHTNLIAGLTSDRTAHTNLLGGMKNSLGIVSNDLDTAESTISSHTTSLTSLDKRADTNESSHIIYDSTFVAHTNLINSLTSDSTAHTNLIVGLTSDRTAHTNLIVGLTSDRTAHTNLIAGLASDRIAHTNLLVASAYRDTAHTNLIDHLSGRIDTNDLLLAGVPLGVTNNIHMGFSSEAQAWSSSYGYYANAAGMGGVAIGAQSFDPGLGVAIGWGATNEMENSVVIGQYAHGYGGVAIGNGAYDSSHCTVIGNGTYGNYYDIVIGDGALNSGGGSSHNVLIGNHVSSTMDIWNTFNCIAIGAYARLTNSTGNLTNTIQIGLGTNSGNGTMQVWNHKLLDIDGNAYVTRLNISTLPTSTNGLVVGDLWRSDSNIFIFIP